MTNTEPTEPPESARDLFDITLRVGCNLAYHSTGPAALLLNVSPEKDPAHAVIFEALTVGNNLAVEAFIDSHGNHVRRVHLEPGDNFVRHDAIVAVRSLPEDQGATAGPPLPPGNLPPDVLRYTLPSRYADSDKLVNFAWETFGQVEHGYPRVRAISRWIHENLEYRYLSGDAQLSAWDILQRGYGVCRDFAHLNIALNRTFNIPTRYVTGHMPDIAYPDPENHMDFHAYAEVYLGGSWFITDARFDVPRIGRVKVSCGQDAIDGAFSTIYGGATLSFFQVWAYQVEHGRVAVGDDLDFSKRVDNQHEVFTDPPFRV